MAETIGDIVAQEMIEQMYSRKHVDKKIRTEIEASPLMGSRIAQGIDLVHEYLSGSYYPKKASRVAQLSHLDVPEVVVDMLVGIAYFQRPELFTSASAQLAARLKFSDLRDAIATVAELLAVLCQTDAFDITKEGKLSSLMLVSRIPLSDGLIKFVEHSQYLPPMVCEPLELTHNYSSGYLTHNSSRILGTGNHHSGDICLAVLNQMNKVSLKLDTVFLSKVEQEPTFELDTPEKVQQWLAYKKQSYHFYELMVRSGNNFYFEHSVCKRGRIYPSGYHLNYQGTSFQKSCLEFTTEEYVEGLP